ncbi:MAG: hypothetical protein C0506_06400, partial [Anaerolinea sp.]|nr:hypothetical protein [Anaerolinea sp.]
MQEVRVGNLQLVALVDNVQLYPATAVYPEAGDALDAHAAHLDAEKRVALNFGCFFVADGDARLLVDTGWGPEYNGKLLEELREAGIEPASISRVLFTHLHGDHTGWNIDRASGKPVFANARYLVPKGDWGYYSSQATKPASFVRDVEPLYADGRVDLIEGEHRLSAGLTTVPTPGHTPGHTSVAISSAGERGFILGDVVISPIDVEEPSFKNSFDWDSGTALRTRLAMLDRLAGDGSMVGASHL